MRYVPGVKISGCTSYIYTWVEIIIDAERTLGYSVYTIKNTANSDPSHFWVYNNGITVLVHFFEEKTENNVTYIRFKGISIINGAQTTGAIGSLENPPEDDALVQVRFIECTTKSTLREIVKYNNSQNKVDAPDYRSKDPIQKRLVEEFGDIPNVNYQPRRGGAEDCIRRRQNVLPSVTAGQALASFHQEPGNAYHKKTKIWESDELYSKYFNEGTTAKHILFAYSLLKAVESTKIDLLNKSKNGNLTGVEKEQLTFFRKRGSTFMLVSAIAKSLEVILNTAIPNLFSVEFEDNFSPEDASTKWRPIVNSAKSFAETLIEGLSDGFRTDEIVQDSINNFRRLMDSVKEGNAVIFSTFAENVN